MEAADFASARRGWRLPCPADHGAHSPEARLLAEEGLRELALALESLPERDRQVLVARHGLVDQPARTLREVGTELRLSKERVRQIEDRAKDCVRRHIARRASSLRAPARASAGP